MINFKKCLTSPNHLIKLVVVVCCLGFSIYQVGQCILRILNPPITTYYGFNLNESMTYPSVTICRRPGFKETVLQSYRLNIGSNPNGLLVANAFRNFDFENHTIQQFVDDSTYVFEQQFLTHAFNGIGNSDANVSVVGFNSITYGKCFTIQPLETSSTFSQAGGLAFFLFHDVLEPVIDSNMLSLYGYHVFVHDSNEFMTSDEDQNDNFLEYLYIEASEDIRVHLRYQQFVRVRSNDNPCIDDPLYSRSRCMEECFQYKVANRTNCTLTWLWMLPENHLPQCNSLEQLEMFASYFLRHNRKTLTADCSCPNSCTVSIYTPTIIYRKEVTTPNKPNCYLALFYSNNLVTDMKEVVGYNFTAFISDIGGSLGFLLGLSVVGLIHFLERLLSSIIKRYYRKKKKPEDGVNSETQSNMSSNASGSTKVMEETHKKYHDNLRDFDSDDFKHYEKSLVAQGSTNRF